MLPIGPLMIEHRLIERMIALLRKETARMDRERTIDARFLDTFFDFLQNYADRLHHGKEEDILFKELDRKDLPQDLRGIMAELLDEHRQARGAMLGLREAKEKVQAGREAAFPEVLSHAQALVVMYPKHIDKEDNHFFLPCMQYLSSEERDAMLAREYEFDRSLFQQLYKEMVLREEERRKA
jgi:hemerythrin-like domain-containing protein